TVKLRFDKNDSLFKSEIERMFRDGERHRADIEISSAISVGDDLSDGGMADLSGISITFD
ncbi:hypothetical protein FBU30_005308, partial [Linnemannia zychae]